MADRTPESTRRCVLLKADGTEEGVDYEYGEDWQEKILGGKVIELGEIACIGALLVAIDPDSDKAGSLAKNEYPMPEPAPELLESYKESGKLVGDIIAYDGDGNFDLEKWLMYKENPEEFEDEEDEDEEDEEDDEDSEVDDDDDDEDSGDDDEEDDEDEGESGGDEEDDGGSGDEEDGDDDAPEEDGDGPPKKKAKPS